MRKTVKIRLSRLGKHKRPFYRIVVADSRSPRDGRFLEVVGTYDPLAKENAVRLDSAKVAAWVQKGAKASDTVRDLMRKTKAVASG